MAGGGLRLARRREAIHSLSAIEVERIGSLPEHVDKRRETSVATVLRHAHIFKLALGEGVGQTSKLKQRGRDRSVVCAGGSLRRADKGDLPNPAFGERAALSESPLPPPATQDSLQ